MFIGVGHAALCPTYTGAALIETAALAATADFKLLLAGSISQLTGKWLVIRRRPESSKSKYPRRGQIQSLSHVAGNLFSTGYRLSPKVGNPLSAEADVELTPPV
jgi:hypothetical protein